MNEIFAVTENVDGKVYYIDCAIKELIDDWNGNCDMVPANDARVYFAAHNNDPINPYLYTDFESLIQLILERWLDKTATDNEDSDLDWDYDPKWKYIAEKWGAEPDRDMMTKIEEMEFVEDLYNAYEKGGFVPYFQSVHHNNEPFVVIGRVPIDDKKLFLFPAWEVRFEDGDQCYAFSDEICFAEIFPHLSKKLLPYLNRKLEDDGTGNGNISFAGESVMDFLMNLEGDTVRDLETLNIALKKCGIVPIEPIEKK